MTFDPFGDFATQGYLRNLAKEKDPDNVRRLEHASFMTGIDAALERLAKVKRLSYADVLETHKTLFEAVYPWAGQDRRTTAPDLAISKGPVLLAPLSIFSAGWTMRLLTGRTRNSCGRNPAWLWAISPMLILSSTATGAPSW